MERFDAIGNMGYKNVEPAKTVLAKENKKNILL